MILMRQISTEVSFKKDEVDYLSRLNKYAVNCPPVILISFYYCLFFCFFNFTS